MSSHPEQHKDFLLAAWRWSKGPRDQGQRGDQQQPVVSPAGQRCKISRGFRPRACNGHGIAVPQHHQDQEAQPEDGEGGHLRRHRRELERVLRPGTQQNGSEQHKAVASTSRYLDRRQQGEGDASRR